jgi:hypothetical protein
MKVDESEWSNAGESGNSYQLPSSFDEANLVHGWRHFGKLYTMELDYSQNDQEETTFVLE